MHFMTQYKMTDLWRQIASLFVLFLVLFLQCPHEEVDKNLELKSCVSNGKTAMNYVFALAEASWSKTGDMPPNQSAESAGTEKVFEGSAFNEKPSGSEIKSPSRNPDSHATSGKGSGDKKKVPDAQPIASSDEPSGNGAHEFNISRSENANLNNQIFLKNNQSVSADKAYGSSTGQPAAEMKDKVKNPTDISADPNAVASTKARQQVQKQLSLQGVSNEGESVVHFGHAQGSVNSRDTAESDKKNNATNEKPEGEDRPHNTSASTQEALTPEESNSLEEKSSGGRDSQKNKQMPNQGVYGLQPDEHQNDQNGTTFKSREFLDFLESRILSSGIEAQTSQALKDAKQQQKEAEKAEKDDVHDNQEGITNNGTSSSDLFFYPTTCNVPPVATYHGIIGDNGIPMKDSIAHKILPFSRLYVKPYLLSPVTLIESMAFSSSCIVKKSDDFSYSYSDSVMPICEAALSNVPDCLKNQWSLLGPLNSVFDVIRQMTIISADETSSFLSSIERNTLLVSLINAEDLAENAIDIHQAEAILADSIARSGEGIEETDSSRFLSRQPTIKDTESLTAGFVGFGVCAIPKILLRHNDNIVKASCDCLEHSMFINTATKCATHNSLLTAWGCASLPPPCPEVNITTSEMHIEDMSSLDLPALVDLHEKMEVIPDEVPEEIVQKEGFTYYLLWKAIDTVHSVYGAAYCARKYNKGDPFVDNIIPGWTTEAYLYTAPSVDEEDSHLSGIISRREETLLIALRGTRTKYEWKLNFEISKVSHANVTYVHDTENNNNGNNADDGCSNNGNDTINNSNNSSSNNSNAYQGVHTLQWPGKIYNGVNFVFEGIFPAVIQHLKKTNVISNNNNYNNTTSNNNNTNNKKTKRIIVTGHSQGGAVAMLLSYQLASLLQNEIKVDYVGFGVVKIGDTKFVEEYSKKVNGRVLAFTLDPVPEMPCTRISACNSDQSFVPTVCTESGGKCNHTRGEKENKDTANNDDDKTQEGTGSDNDNTKTNEKNNEHNHEKKKKQDGEQEKEGEKKDDDDSFYYAKHKAMIHIKPEVMPTSNWRARGANFRAYAAHWCSYNCFLSTQFAKSDSYTQCDAPNAHDNMPYNGNICKYWIKNIV